MTTNQSPDTSCHYYYRHKGTPANPWILCVLIGNWPERSLKHRGIRDEYYIGSRKLTDKEVDYYSYQWRCNSFFYTTVMELIEDELQHIDENHEIIVKLKKLHKDRLRKFNSKSSKKSEKTLSHPKEQMNLFHTKFNEVCQNLTKKPT